MLSSSALVKFGILYIFLLFYYNNCCWCIKRPTDDRGSSSREITETTSQGVDQLRLKQEQEDERLNALRHNRQLQLAQVMTVNYVVCQTCLSSVMSIVVCLFVCLCRKLKPTTRRYASLSNKRDSKNVKLCTLSVLNSFAIARV